MKTMKLIRFGLLVMAVATLALNGCRKDKDTDNPTDTSKIQQTSMDKNLVNANVDDAMKDCEKVMSGSGGKSMNWIPCNATIDSTYTIADTVTYIITYNGLNCNGRFYRVGTVEVHKCLTTHWYDQGATVYVKFINVKFTKVSNGKWAIINGTKMFRNETGGRLHDLGSTFTTITHRVTGSITATFEDNTTRVWTISRLKTFTGTEGDLLCSVSGFGTADGYSNLETWGTTRHGDPFYCEISIPVVFKEICGWDPVSGTGTLSIPADNASATVTFGYDDNNQPVNNGDCPTRYKIDWQKNGHSGTLFIQL
jgi:hypothetical protein